MFNIDYLSKKNGPVKHCVFDWTILFGGDSAGGLKQNKSEASAEHRCFSPIVNRKT
jgi:hypothetical protein